MKGQQLTLELTSLLGMQMTVKIQKIISLNFLNSFGDCNYQNFTHISRNQAIVGFEFQGSLPDFSRTA